MFWLLACHDPALREESKEARDSGVAEDSAPSGDSGLTGDSGDSAPPLDNDLDDDGHDAVEAGGDDCDDADPAVNPGAPEVCDNGVDDDCYGGTGACALAGSVTVADADATLGPGEQDSYFGNRLAVGDVTGDGVNDIVVGAIWAQSQRGATYVFSEGATSGSRSQASVTVVGDANDWAGNVHVADLDGDGVGDLLVGNHGGGVLRAFYGPMDGRLDSSDATTTYDPAGYLHGTGTAALLSDIDGNGKTDLVFGGYGVAAFPTSRRGNLDVDDAVLTISGGNYCGDSLGAADFNGDGLDELVVSCHPAGGGVYIEEGPVGGTNYALEGWARIGNPSDGYIGAALALDDVDGDGTVDLIASSRPTTGRSGSVFLWTTVSRGTLSCDLVNGEINETADGGSLGTSLSRTDLDGDGGAELLAGAYTAGANSGAVYIFDGDLSGTHSSDEARAVIGGAEEGDMLYAIATGDLDGTGIADLVVGAPAAQDGLGAAYVFTDGL